MNGSKANQSRQLANDLRKSHFTLGTAGPRSRVSEYVAEYQGKKAHLETSQKDKLNLRASHFNFGPHDPAKTFCTINKKDFKEHPGFHAPQLNEEKKRDLRSSHFTLGNYNPNYTSLNRAEFQEKYIPIGLHKQEQEVQKNKMRKHNHDFTETHKKQFSSEYNANFNKLNDPTSLKQGLTSQELKQKVIDLRKSHVVLGEDYKPMQSVAQADYKSKQSSYVPPANDNVNIRRTNFKLGGAQDEYISVSQQYFVAHPPQKSDFQGALGQDLRATHFTLGQEEPMYATNNAAAFRGPPSGFKPPQTLNPNLQKNHFTVGNPHEAMQNKTTYSNYHRDFGNATAAQARDQTMDRGSNWKLGGQTSNWATEAQSRYKAYVDAKPADLEGGLKADLRSSHFKFNDVKPQYSTLTQSSYGPKQAAPNKLDEALKKDLQTNHFKLGTGNNHWATSSGLAFQPNNGKPSNLDPSLAKDLRANHFVHGDGKWQTHTATEYRSNYFWKNENEVTA